MSAQPEHVQAMRPDADPGAEEQSEAGDQAVAHHRLTAVIALVGSGLGTVTPQNQDPLPRVQAADRARFPTLLERACAEGRQAVRISVHGEADLDTTDWFRGLVAELWRAPSGGLVLTVTVAVAPPSLLRLIPVLGALNGLQVQVEGRALLTWVQDRLGAPLADPGSLEFGLERHQVLALSHGVLNPDGNIDQVTLSKLSYRYELTQRESFASYALPAELNRSLTTVGAVGPHVSVLEGHDDATVNGVRLSANTLVDVARQLRTVWTATGRLQAELQPHVPAGGGEDLDPHVRMRLATMERLQDDLGRLTLDLVRRVRDHLDIGLFMGSQRLPAYHLALVEALSLRRRLEEAERQVTLLEAVTRARAASLSSRLALITDHRQGRYTTVLTVLTVLTVPLALFLAYFGINTTDVSADQPLFAREYVPEYASFLSLLLLGLIGGAWARRSPRQDPPAPMVVERLLDPASDVPATPTCDGSCSQSPARRIPPTGA